jgi:uncharacterized membrane protein
MPVLLGLIGGAVGAAFGLSTSLLGFAVGILAGLLTETRSRLASLHQQIGEMREQSARFESTLSALERRAAETAPAAAPQAVPETAVPPPPPSPKPRAPVQPPPALPVTSRALPGRPQSEPVLASSTPIPESIERPEIAPPATAWFVEFFTTGNVVAKVGMVVVFFGVAFLVRYASEHGWLPIEFRLMGVAAGSLVLLGVGWRVRHSRPEYGVVLQGGAVGVLYMTIFAAFRLYELLPAPLAFGLLLLVVAFSGMLAVAQDTVSLAVLGASGGFLAPILASTGGGSHVALFSYYAVLNAGVLGIAWFRSWRFLNWLAFVFTFGIGFVWGAQYYQPQMLGTTEPFLVFFFLLFVVVSILFAHRLPPQLRGYIDGTLVFGTPAIAFGMQSILVRDIPLGRAYSAVAVSALYLALARLLWTRDPVLRPLGEAFLALAVVFLIVAVPLAFDGHATAAAWALEGAGLVWIGVRQDRLLARLAGSLLPIGAGVAFAVMTTSPAGAMPVLNTQFLGCVAIAAGSIVCGEFLSKVREGRSSVEGTLEWLVLVWGLLWWFGGALAEIDRHVPSRWSYAAAYLTVAASLCAIGSLARWWQWRPMMHAALPIGPLMWVSVLFVYLDRADAGPLTDLGWLTWPVVVASSYLAMYWFESIWPPPLVSAWHAGASWLIVFLVTWTAVAPVARLVPETPTWAWTLWAVVPAIFVLAIRGLGASVAWPIRRFQSLYERPISFVPVVGILIWVLWACGQRGEAAPLPYVPIANPIELTQVLGLIVAFVWWRASRGDVSEEIGRAFALALAGLAFLALNVLVARAVHFYAGVRFDPDDLIESAIFQTGVSILWALTAGSLMTLALRRASRPVWVTGASLLAALILKLFVVDLSNVGGVARIVSFLATGLLILAIGYFAPLPPRTEKA